MRYVNWPEGNCLFGTPGSDRDGTIFRLSGSKRFIQLLSVHDQQIDVYHVLQVVVGIHCISEMSSNYEAFGNY